MPGIVSARTGQLFRMPGIVSACTGQLRKNGFRPAYRSLQQRHVLFTKRNTTMTVRGTETTVRNSEALPKLIKGGKVVVPQSSSTAAFFSTYDQILKFATEKLKSITGIHGQHPPGIFDVIISYKRDDTRNFVSHLKGAVERRGIRTFVDYTLDEGQEILPAIEEVIKQSNIAVVVVSQNFHTSPWCLNELVKILECQKKRGLIVFPIFWGINAKELREQSSPFVENIGQGEEGFKQEKPNQVRRWKSALRALGMINGFAVSARLDKTEAEVIEYIANKILAKINLSV